MGGNGRKVSGCCWGDWYFIFVYDRLELVGGPATFLSLPRFLTWVTALVSQKLGSFLFFLMSVRFDLAFCPSRGWSSRCCRRAGGGMGSYAKLARRALETDTPVMVQVSWMISLFLKFTCPSFPSRKMKNIWVFLNVAVSWVRFTYSLTVVLVKDSLFFHIQIQELIRKAKNPISLAQVRLRDASFFLYVSLIVCVLFSFSIDTCYMPIWADLEMEACRLIIVVSIFSSLSFLMSLKSQ